MTLTFLHFFNFFYVFFRDFSKLKHPFKVLLGLFHRGELNVHPVEAVALALAWCAADLTGVVVNVHDRLGHGTNHQLQGRHFQGRGLPDLGNDAFLGGGSALPCLGHANGVHGIAGLVLGVPGLGGGQGEHAGSHGNYVFFVNFEGFEKAFLCFFLVPLLAKTGNK